MNCFNHRDRSAVGICKSCGKGLCRDCATDLHDGLACKGRCESQVKLLNRLIDDNSRMVAAARLQTRMRNIMIAVIGAVLTVLAVWEYTLSNDVTIVAFFGSLGVILVVFGLTGLIRKAQYPRIEEPTAGAERGLD